MSDLWYEVVFAQGEEVGAFIDANNDGTLGTLLGQYDYGEETYGAAAYNGDVESTERLNQLFARHDSWVTRENGYWVEFGRDGLWFAAWTRVDERWM